MHRHAANGSQLSAVSVLKRACFAVLLLALPRVGLAAPISAVLNPGGHLVITGTPGPDDVLLRLDPSSSILWVDDHSNGVGVDFVYPFGSVTDISISMGDGDDQVVLDDTGGAISALRPLTVDVGDGDNSVVGSTGSLTSTEIGNIGGILSNLRTVLAGVADLRNTADALRTTAAHRAIEGEALRASAASLIEQARAMIDQAKLDSAAVEDELMPYESDLLNQRDAIQGLATFFQNRVAAFTSPSNLNPFFAAVLADSANRDSTAADSVIDERREQAINDYVLDGDTLATDAETFFSGSASGLDGLRASLEQAGDSYLNDRLLAQEAAGDALSTNADNTLVTPAAAFETAMGGLESDANALEASANALVTQIYGVIGNMLNDPTPATTPPLRSQATSCNPITFCTFIGAGLIIGTPFNDHLIGSPGTDFMFGGKGNDLIEGNGGLDFLWGGGGDDDLRGGDGYDILMGWTGNDCMDGGADSDLLFGGTGDDLLDGYRNQPANSCTEIHIPVIEVDLSLGDFLWGGDGDDTMNGSDCIDLMFGRDGNDQMTGNDGMDFMFGGKGVDTENGGKGGGFKIDGDDISPPLGNLEFGGDDNDTVNGGDDIDILFGNLGVDTMDGGDQTDLMFGGPGADDMHGGKGVDVMFGLADADVMHGDGDPNLMFGNDAVDTMFGGNTVDLMFGGVGADIMTAGDGLSLMFGNSADDELHVDKGVTFMFGGDGNDKFFGGGLLNLLNVMFGGKDPDTMSGGSVVNVMFGGDDVDTMSGGNSTAGIDFMFGNAEADIMNGNAGIDLMFGGPGGDTMNGGSETDLVVGGDGCDTMHGNAGIDVMLGVDANDTMYGDSEADIMLGNGENDQMWGGTGVDVMLGGTGSDILHGEDGFDILIGNDDVDVLYGGPVADLLIGSIGDDILYGEAGVDLAFGGPGSDCIDGGTEGDVVFGGADADQVFGGSNNDLVFGNDGDDCVDGGDNTDFVFGNDGNDKVNGGPGADFVFGGKGADTMNGDDGDDYMFGGKDADTMYGGAGRDIMFGNGSPDDMHGGDGWDWCFGGPGDDTIEGDGPNRSADAVCVPCNASTGVLKGTAFIDRNCNGVLDASEPGLGSWVITYTGPVSGSVFTASNGTYSITGLPAGTYTICEVIHPGWTQSTPIGCYKVKLVTGETVSGLNFGNCATGSTEDVAPSRFEMRGARPNPMTTRASFTVVMPQSGLVTLRVYDMAGRMVATVAEGRFYSAGTHELELSRSGLRSGMYMSRLVVRSADGGGVVFEDTKRIVLVR